MDIIIFDLRGKLAHFRKFYTNSSSLSYAVPPRTTVMGIVAAILGFERDSYYETFSREKMDISVRKMNPTRNIMQTVNYIKADNDRSLLLFKEHTQIPFELVTGNQGVVYRIYIHHEDGKLMDELAERCIKRRPVFTPYLGAAPFGCSINFIDRINGKPCQCSDYVEISSLINMDYMINGGLKLCSHKMMILKEKMPAEILKGRTITKASSYIFDNLGNPLNVKLKHEFYSLNYCQTSENILFM